MNIKETFLKLTEFLIPYKSENLLEKYLPTGIQQDIVGNYHMKVGESRSMFCCHLDSYTKKLTPVTHVLYDDGKKVKTDGKSPLGGDDKTGMCIMLNMIEHNVPGHYYFFIGEEPTLSGGVYGSKNALKNNPEFFKENFDRVISFDRKGYSSIISKQKGDRCCSREFVTALSEQFSKQGLKYYDDPTGYYTDSAVFMFVCPEITNLSCGGFNEHKDYEWVDLEYLEKLADVCTRIEWEKLPIVRNPLKDAPKSKEKVKNFLKGGGNKIFSFKGFTKKSGYDLYKVIKDYLYYYYLVPKAGQKFIEGKNVLFINDSPKTKPGDLKSMNIRIHGTQIWVNDCKIGSLYAFESKYNINFDCKFYNHVKDFMLDLQAFCQIYNTTKISYHDVQILLKRYGDFTVNELVSNYNNSKLSLFDVDDFTVDDMNRCLIVD